MYFLYHIVSTVLYVEQNVNFTEQSWLGLKTKKKLLTKILQSGRNELIMQYNKAKVEKNPVLSDSWYRILLSWLKIIQRYIN